MRIFYSFKAVISSFIIVLFAFTFVSAKTVLRTDEAAIGEADPAKATDYVDSVLMFNVYDALVDESPGGGGGLMPLLASNWEYTNPTTLNITLKNA